MDSDRDTRIEEWLVMTEVKYNRLMNAGLRARAGMLVERLGDEVVAYLSSLENMARFEAHKNIEYLRQLQYDDEKWIYEGICTQAKCLSAAMLPETEG